VQSSDFFHRKTRDGFAKENEKASQRGEARLVLIENEQNFLFD